MDAHAFLHRAYHALPPLATSSGMEVGALFGLTRTLVKLTREEAPDYLAVCFDSPGPTFRHAAFAAYKANRKEPEPALLQQLVLSRDLVEALDLQSFESPGYEADDLLASLSKAAQGLGCDVVLVTSDKDVMQLVGEHVRVLRDPKDSRAGLWDAQAVQAKYKVAPERFADYLALVGDSSDNIPGVPGIGGVWAAKLLSQYGDLGGLLRAARAGDAGLSPKLAGSLKSAEENVRLSRTLTALREDLPVSLDLGRCRARLGASDSLVQLFRRLEFDSLLREIQGSAAPRGEPPKASGVVRPPKADASASGGRSHAEGASLERFLKAARRARSVSMHAVSLDRSDLFHRSGVTLCLGLADGTSASADLSALRPAELKALKDLLGSPVLKVVHDLKFCQVALRRYYPDLRIATPFFDTLLASYCLNPSRARYDPLSTLLHHLGLSLEAGDAAPLTSSGTAVLGDVSEGALQGLRIAPKLLELAEVLRKELGAKGLDSLYEGQELPLVEVLAEMERLGVGLDRKYLEVLSKELEEGIRSLQGELDGIAGVELNVQSPKQLAFVLFEKLKLPVIHKTPKGAVSTDEETLKALGSLHPLPGKVLEFRELAKLKSTYADNLLQGVDGQGRVHTHFDQAGTSTGRLSSEHPNLQNIPIRTALGTKIRRAFVPARGFCFLSADYSQIDLRVLAHMSGDAELQRAFREGEDIHAQTACELFGAAPTGVTPEMRRVAKSVVFGVAYGQTAYGLAAELGISQGQAQEYIRRYFERYEGVAAWIKAVVEAARKDGFVRTLSGRVRYLPDLHSKNPAVRSFSERAAVNTPIQGSSADIIKAAMLKIHARLKKGLKTRMVLQVHDDLLFEVPEGELESVAERVRADMEGAVKLKVPVRVDLKFGPNWRDMERI